MAFVSNNRTLISSLSFFKFLNLFCSQQQGRQQRVELERHSSGHGTAIRQQLPDSARREWSTFHRAHLMRYISIFHELLKPRRRAARGKVPEGIIKNGQDVLQKYSMAYTAFGSFFYPRWEDRIAAVRWSRGQNSRQRLVRQKIATQKFK